MPGPCETGQALLEAMEEALGKDAKIPVEDIASPAKRAVASSLGHQWSEHFLACRACERVWIGMALQAGSGRNVDWRSAAIFVEKKP